MNKFKKTENSELLFAILTPLIYKNNNKNFLVLFLFYIVELLIIYLFIDFSLKKLLLIFFSFLTLSRT